MNQFLQFQTPSEDDKEPGKTYLVCIPFDSQEEAYNLLSNYPQGWIESCVG